VSSISAGAGTVAGAPFEAAEPPLAAQSRASSGEGAQPVAGGLRVCLVASSGGHLLELLSLSAAWQDLPDRYWVSFPTEDARALLAGERVVWAHYPTNRSIRNLVRNLWLAWRVLRADRPDAVISTGAGVAVPFLWVGRLLGIQTIFVESLTRIRGLSLSGRLVYPAVSLFFVQWPELQQRYPRTLYRGSSLSAGGEE
jgi:UDP-N-acetylglucosamine:LPS N-acetylglucosamine transferase